ncbi:MAG TPA: efflux RND transporter permease subunit [Candidatus Omnitrophota bacterium]|nr:efflux RND transporter permease subunit [Candidatus Omnitrophota bacterium]HPS36983.1 efflux RND transporter permease subunit [Candidatus Omnitrophota bacterium]
MTLSDISIKNPVFAWMLMIGIIVFGWIGFVQLGVGQLPDVDYPVVNVSITWEGAAPEVMETEVTDIVEDAVMSIEGIKEVTSTSRQGSSQITIEFNLNRSIDAALQEVQTKIAQAQRNLPRDIDPPVVTKTNPEDQPIIWISLSGDRSIKDLTHYISETLKDQFTTVAGVGEVRLGGFVDPNLRVWLDAQKMQAAELTVEDVLNAIGAQHTDLPAGYIDTGRQEINVRVYGEAATPQQFESIIIPQRVRGGPIWKSMRIGDVGSVEDGLADIRRISRDWGKRAIGMGIVKQRGTNAMAVADAVKKRIKELEPLLPSGMELKIVFDSTQFIRESVDELERNLVLAIILTSLVCFLFLGSWSATINVLLAIPTALMGAFLVIYFMGFTINTFTMLGLSLVIGIVVDDAIMVLENISRYQEKGLGRVEAAVVGAREITFAALATSIAILAIFVPVIFMQGVIGRFFFQFGVAISVAVMFSLLEALTIAPMRCSQFLDVGHTTRLGKGMDSLMTRLTAWYKTSLVYCLGHRKKVLVAAGMIFVASILLTFFLKKEFVPSQDQSRFRVQIMLPLGSSMEETDKVFKEAEAFLMQCPEVATVFSGIGGGGGGGMVNQGFILVTMKPRGERPRVNGRRETQQEFMQILRKKFNTLSGVDRAVIQDLSQTGFTAQRGFPVEFTVRGPDWEKLGELSGKIMDEMKASKMMTDIDTDYLLGMPELQIHPDRQKAADRGVSILSIANTINAMVGGVRIGKFTSNGKRYDIRVRLTEKDRSSPKDLQKMWVRNQYGEVVPLLDVVTAETKPSLFSITRKNRERAISIYANPAPGYSQQEALDKVQKIAKNVLPDHYHIVFSGGAQAFKESFGSLWFALILGIFVAYMVLATQFNSFIHPFTVLLALPFSVTGAFVALWISRNSINLYSMIGLILLMGIVKKNSILLVDFTNERRRQGMEVRGALLDACPIRLRPILMTSISTIAAAVPAAIAFGAGSETMVPMAVSVVGGVTVSTILTLFVVPCAYEIFAKFERQSYVPQEKKA